MTVAANYSPQPSSRLNRDGDFVFTMYSKSVGVVTELVKCAALEMQRRPQNPTQVRILPTSPNAWLRLIGKAAVPKTAGGRKIPSRSESWTKRQYVAVPELVKGSVR